MIMAKIHPTAVVDSSADIHSSVEIGPFTVVEDGVFIDEGVSIGSHNLIHSGSFIYSGTVIYNYCSVGCVPQDKKYRHGSTRLEIGKGNTIFEYCTISRGTEDGGGVTRIGDNNWVMAYSHIAHDCLIGSGCVLANGATLAGHVLISDGVVLGGLCAIHQFCRIGEFAMVAGGSIVVQDVPSFVLVAGNRARPRGINREGLRRNGFDDAAIERIKGYYKVVYRSGFSLSEALKILEDCAKSDCNAGIMLASIKNSARGILR